MCTPIVILVQRYVSTKLEVSMAFLVQENQRHGTDGGTVGRTNGRGATLNEARRHGRIIII